MEGSLYLVNTTPVIKVKKKSIILGLKDHTEPNIAILLVPHYMLNNMDETTTPKDSSPSSNPNTDNFFSACETAVKQYSELVETLQIECVKSWKKITESTAVSTQQSQMIGNNNERGCSMPDYTQKIIDELMNHATRFIQFQNNMSSQAFALMIKNIRTVNENPNPIMEFSKSWVNFWSNIGIKK